MVLLLRYRLHMFNIQRRLPKISVRLLFYLCQSSMFAPVWNWKSFKCTANIRSISISLLAMNETVYSLVYHFELIDAVFCVDFRNFLFIGSWLLHDSIFVELNQIAHCSSVLSNDGLTRILLFVVATLVWNICQVFFVQIVKP